MTMNTLCRKETTPGGLTLYTVPMPSMESAAIGFWIKTGSRHEDARIAGISHFLEHLAFKGSKKFSCDEIKSRIEGVGGSMNAFTAEETTCFYVKVPRAHAQEALRVLEDMVCRPLLRATDIEKERKVILEELKMYIDMPQYYVADVLQEMMFPRHALGRRIIGTPASVRAITRKDLLRQQQRSYVVSNMILVAAGALGDTDFQRVRIPLAAREDPPRAKRVSDFQKGPCVEIKKRKTEQLHVALGMYGYPRSSHYRYGLDLLNILLGGNMSSRLFNEIREKRGLTYDIHSSMKYYYDTGVFTVEAGLAPGKLILFIDTVIAVLARFKKEGPTPRELRKAKEYYQGQLVMELEETMHRLWWVGDRLAAGDRVLSPEKTIEMVGKVSALELRMLARHLFSPKNFFCAIVGNQMPALKIEERIRRL